MDNRNEIAALAGELADLARNAPGRIGERIASLPIREQADLALRLEPHLRLELLLHAPRPMRLVRSLPDSELHLTVREVGPADALPLIALASAQQLTHVVDMESWRRDRFDPDRSGGWVALMLDAGDSTIKRFLQKADEELLTLLFQRWIRATAIELDDSPEVHGTGHTEAGDELGLVSPCGYYRFRPTIPEHAPAVQRISQVLFTEMPDLYRRAVWGALYELPAELEEGALHWRQSRLEEHGFPTWEEALSVYAPPEKLQGAASHPRPLAPTDRDGLTSPRSPLNLPAVRDSIFGAVDELPDEVREQALHEFFTLGNRLLVADGGDTGDIQAHREALEKAAGYLTIALEVQDVTDGPDLRRTIEDVPLEELFREGYAQAVDLQARARALTRDGWASVHPGALDLLDSPIRERISGLRQGRPLYHDTGETGGPAGLRPFRARTEIRETRGAVEIAESIGRLMVDHLGLDLGAVVRQMETNLNHPLRFSTFFLTLLAWHSVRGEFRGDPLPADVVATFLRNVASRRTADPDAPARRLEALILGLSGDLRIAQREVAVIDGFGRACVEQLAAECAALDPGAPLDPRYVSCLLIAG